MGKRDEQIYKLPSGKYRFKDMNKMLSEPRGPSNWLWLEESGSDNGARKAFGRDCACVCLSDSYREGQTKGIVKGVEGLWEAQSTSLGNN